MIISNRKQFLIYSTEKSVFYFQLLVTEQSMYDTANTTLSPASTISPNPSPIIRRTSEISSTTMLSSALSRQTIESAVVIRVFGVDLVNSELREGLVSLIESKVSALLQIDLSLYLSRNISSKLTQSDIDFILPVKKTPSIIELFKIPGKIQSLYTLLMCFKQNLLLFMNLLSGTNVYTTINDYYHEKGIAKYQGYFLSSIIQSIIISLEATFEQRIGDLSFIYSGVSTRFPSQLELHFGFGIAAVCMVCIDKNGHILQDIPSINDDEYSILVEVIL